MLDALEMAAWRRDLIEGCVHHSDAGSQYTSIRYTDRLADAGLNASIGTIGDSYDNAMAEALNGTFKAELVKLHGPWRTRRQLEIAIIEWIDWSRYAGDPSVVRAARSGWLTWPFRLVWFVPTVMAVA